MRIVSAVCVVLALASVLCVRQAKAQTVNLFGQNWTGDVSPHRPHYNCPLVACFKACKQQDSGPASTFVIPLTWMCRTSGKLCHCRGHTTAIREDQEPAVSSTQTRRHCHGQQEQPSGLPWTSPFSMVPRHVACA